MAASRLRRAGILALVLWLTADLAAFGFCSGEPVFASVTSASLGAADNGDGPLSCCAGHHCFCCSSGAEVMTFELSFVEQTVLMTASPEPHTADTSIRNTSPPPRF